MKPAGIAGGTDAVLVYRCGTEPDPDSSWQDNLETRTWTVKVQILRETPPARHGAAFIRAAFIPIFPSFGPRAVFTPRFFSAKMLQLIVYFIRLLCCTEQRRFHCSVTQHSCRLKPGKKKSSSEAQPELKKK